MYTVAYIRRYDISSSTPRWGLSSPRVDDILAALCLSKSQLLFPKPLKKFSLFCINSVCLGPTRLVQLSQNNIVPWDFSSYMHLADLLLYNWKVKAPIHSHMTLTSRLLLLLLHYFPFRWSPLKLTKEITRHFTICLVCRVSVCVTRHFISCPTPTTNKYSSFEFRGNEWKLCDTKGRRSDTTTTRTTTFPLVTWWGKWKWGNKNKQTNKTTKILGILNAPRFICIATNHNSWFVQTYKDKHIHFLCDFVHDIRNWNCLTRTFCKYEWETGHNPSG